MPSLHNFARLPAEEIKAEHLVQFFLGATTVCGIIYIIVTLVNAKFFPKTPGERVTGKVATYSTKPKQAATAETLENVKHKYDYIIVGGGTAGCVLANRLSEDRNIKVLLVESGTSDLEHFYTRVPAGFVKVFRTTADWDIKTTEQRQLGGRVLGWPRGKMLYCNLSCNVKE